jgi:hypothetical protein
MWRITAELFLFVVTTDRRPGLDVLGPAFTGSHGWVRREVTAQFPEDAEHIRFGVTLTGPGQMTVRNSDLPSVRR